MAKLTQFNENTFDPTGIKNDAMTDVLNQQDFQAIQAGQQRQKSIEGILASPGDMRSKAEVIMPLDKDLGFELLEEARAQRTAQHNLRKEVFKSMRETAPNINSEQDYRAWRLQMGAMSEGIEGFEMANFPHTFEEFKPLKNVLMGEVKGIDALDKSVMTYEKYLDKYGPDDSRTRAAVSAMEKRKDELDATERKNLELLTKDFTVGSVSAYSQSNNIRDLVRLPPTGRRKDELDATKRKNLERLTDDFTLGSVNVYSKSNDIRDLVRLPPTASRRTPSEGSATSIERKVVERAIEDSDLKGVEEGADAMKNFIADEAKLRMNIAGGSYETHVRDVMGEVKINNIGKDDDLVSPDPKFMRDGLPANQVIYGSKEELREAFRAGKFKSEEEAIEVMQALFPEG